MEGLVKAQSSAMAEILKRQTQLLQVRGKSSTSCCL